TQGYLAVDVPKKTIYLAFQGTTNPSTLLVSLNVPRSKLQYGGSLNENAYVHSGFQNAYTADDVRPIVQNALRTTLTQFKGYNLHAIGHSLGSAIATLSVLDLLETSPNLISPSKIFITSFGSPRIGNYDFARLVDTLGNARRVIHSSDVVARFPTTPLGFRHGGTEFW
ncbi:Alpha/Beta hydrolase protein, partial [Chytridium lagenaria]